MSLGSGGGRLAGRRVLVTRAEADARELGRQLAERGAEAVFFPTIVRRPAPDPAAAVAAWGAACEVDRVLVGSFAALEAWAELPPLGAPVRVACVGEATARRIRAFWPSRFEVREIARTRRAEGLVEVLLDALGTNGRLEGRAFLFPRAPEGRTTLIEALRELGAVITPVSTYQIGCADAQGVERVEGVEVFTFFSGRTLECFLEATGATGRERLARGRVAVLGPVAAARARALGVRVDVVPGTASTEALVDALDR